MPKSNIDWNKLQGMTEVEAEKFMLEKWGRIPEDWYDPLFRQRITGHPFDIEAHMDQGQLGYGSDKKLGKAAKGVWWKRNVDGQGHPDEGEFKNRSQRRPGEKK